MLAGPLASLPCQTARPMLGRRLRGLLRGDDRPEGASKRSRTLASRALRLIAIAALVVVAAIAVGAASRPHSVELSLSAPQVGELAVLVALVLAASFGLIMGSNPFRFSVSLPDRELLAKEPKSQLPRGVRAVLILMPLITLAFVLAAAVQLGNGKRLQLNLPGVAPVVASNSAAESGASLVLACVVVALVASLVAAVLFRGARPVGTVQAHSSKDDVEAILDEGLGALLAEMDPRKAVIRAYVAMERAMARKGWARRPHEAPTEYLARVLGVAPSRAQDLDELVNLYEFARFSEHIVTPAMRDAAVDSVRRLRAELQEPA